MIDSQSAVSTAAFQTLNAETGVTDLADVWQNPPEDTQPITKGLVIVGLVSISSGDDKDGGLDAAEFTISTAVTKTDARLLYALNTAVRNALEAGDLTFAGALIDQPVFVSDDPSWDGQTYRDELHFRTVVQPA